MATTSRNTTDQIIAHVDLLRAIDRLLSEAAKVREKREILERVLTSSDKHTTSTAAGQKRGKSK